MKKYNYILRTKEMKIMNCLWKKSPLSCIEILNDDNFIGWNVKSTNKILRKLVKKNAIKVESIRNFDEQSKPTNLYVPTISNDGYYQMMVRQLSKSVLCCVENKRKFILDAQKTIDN